MSSILKFSYSFLFIFLVLHQQAFSQVQLNLAVSKHHKLSENIPVPIRVIDRRTDTTAALGKVRVDFRKGLEPLVSKLSLAKDMEFFYQKLYHIDAADRRALLILVYGFDAQENISGLGNQIASVKYSADFFMLDRSNHYHHLGAIDTTVLLEAYDVTSYLFTVISNTLHIPYKKFVGEGSSIDQALDLNELMTFREQERDYFKAYKEIMPPNGAYASWSDFLALRKTEGILVEENAESFKFISHNKKGKVRYALSAIYKVIVFEGKPYYLNAYRYHPMVKKEEDYFVTTRLARLNNKHPEAIGLVMMYGLFGSLFKAAFISPKHLVMLDCDLYECKVNFRTGSLIPLKKISNKERRNNRH